MRYTPFARIKREAYPPTVIISACRPGMSKAEQARRFRDLAQEANRVASVQHATGAWEGTREQSLVISHFEYAPGQFIRWATSKAIAYNQDAFLYIDSDRFVWLHRRDAPGRNRYDKHPLGNLLTSPTEPKHVPGWTFIRGKGYYFTVPGTASEPEKRD